jgi:hypothetical protein
MLRKESSDMTDTLDFIQNQDYEGIQVTFTKAGAVLDISTATEISFRAFSIDYSTLRFSGTKTGGEVTFLTDGTDGIAIYNTQADDMNESERLRGEFEVVLPGASNTIKKQGLIVNIKPQAPTS